MYRIVSYRMWVTSLNLKVVRFSVFVDIGMRRHFCPSVHPSVTRRCESTLITVGSRGFHRREAQELYLLIRISNTLGPRETLCQGFKRNRGR